MFWIRLKITEKPPKTIRFWPVLGDFLITPVFFSCLLFYIYSFCDQFMIALFKNELIWVFFLRYKMNA